MCGIIMDTINLVPVGVKPVSTSPNEAERVRKSVGFVYCMESDAFPGLVKIGRSKNVTERLSALNTGCAPKPLRVVGKAKTLNAVRDEKHAHLHFAHVRGEGEYFSTSVAEVNAFFDKEISRRYIDELEGLMGI